MTNKQSVVLNRFLRGGFFSAISAMVVIVPVGIGSFTELTPWFASLALAGIIGFISGGLQALDKLRRYEEQNPEEGS